jgi:acyl-CoA thioester hydrolase
MRSPAPKNLSTPLQGTPASAWDSSARIPKPLQLHTPTVLAQWVDYNGHMSESCFLLVFGDSSDAFFRFIGIDERYRDEQGLSLYTVETHIHNLREATEGETLKLTLQVLDVDEKRIHIFHSMYRALSGELLATGEQMLLHVDMVAGRAAPMPPWLLERVQAIHRAHSTLPLPKQVGASIGIRHK